MLEDFLLYQSYVPEPGGSGSPGDPEVVALLQALADDVAGVKNRIFSMGADSLTIQSPVLSGGTVELVRGGDYRVADGRALAFTITGPMILALAPSLASVRLIIDSVATLQVLGTFITTLQGVDLSFDITAAQTRTIPKTSTSYYIEGTTTSGHDLPLTKGALFIRHGGE